MVKPTPKVVGITNHIVQTLIIFSLGTVHISLMEEEIKYLKEPYKGSVWAQLDDWGIMPAFF